MNIRTATKPNPKVNHTLKVYDQPTAEYRDGKGKLLAKVTGTYHKCVENASVHFPKEKFIWIWS